MEKGIKGLDGKQDKGQRKWDADDYTLTLFFWFTFFSFSVHSFICSLVLSLLNTMIY